MSKIIEGGNKGCKNCGGSIEFSPSFNCLWCEKCGSKSTIIKNDYVALHEYNSTLDNPSKTTVTIRCEKCGANVVVYNNVHAAVCPYCKSSVVLALEHMQGLKPDGIIPFAFDKNRARGLFKENIKSKWFLPNKFKKDPLIKNIKGIYIPSFSFNQLTTSSYNGRLGQNHTATDGSGKMRTYTTYRNISGSINLDHKNIFIESGSQISQAQLEQIKPYDTRAFCGYNEDFVRGFSVEYYTDRLEDCKKQGDLMIDNIIRSSILRQYQYDFVSYLNVSTSRSQETFSYLILPTYQIELTYKDKKYLTLMNGQTGKVGSNLPRSGVKITFFVLGLLLIFLLVTLGLFFIVQ